MTETRRPLKVFLSYASQDKPLVRELSRRLVGEGWIDTWLDEKNLLPGQDWRLKIEEAVEDSDIIIICLSSNSVTKEGYVQKELRYAREIALEKPEDTIFLVPLRLNECDVPRGLRFYQWADYFGEEKERTYAALLESLRLRYAERLRAEEEKRIRFEREKQERDAAERIAREKAARERSEHEARERARWEAEEQARRRIEAQKTPDETLTKGISVQTPAPGAVKRQRFPQISIIIFVFISIGVICAGSIILPKLLDIFTNTPGSTPTNDAVAIFTFAAQTVEAQATRNAFLTTNTPMPITPTSFAADTLTPTMTSTPACDLAEFVRDVTIPDGTVLSAGQKFTKTWRFKNIGTCTWSGYSIVFDSGDLMNGSTTSFATVAPGQEVDISVNLTAPSTSGTYRGYWRIRNASGTLIPIKGGNQEKSFFLEIKVNSLTATPTP